MKQGTEWTEPGKGAMVIDLWNALPEVYRDYDAKDAAFRFTSSANNLRRLVGAPRTVAGAWTNSTNLLLTGEPLNAEDLQRIAECK